MATQDHPVTLPINEIFETLQGEAHWTGSPAVFVRFQYCPISCPFCDTKHTWKLDTDKEIPFYTMITKVKDAPTYAQVQLDKLVEHIASLPSRHVVFTGGEPAAYDLVLLTSELVRKGKSVQIETSGTFDIKVSSTTWITLSPKINMPGGYQFKTESIARANEIKMPVGKMRDVEQLKALLVHRKHPIDVWLQPLSQSPKATALCIEQARLNGWRLSVQTHKYIGLR